MRQQFMHARGKAQILAEQQAKADAARKAKQLANQKDAQDKAD